MPSKIDLSAVFMVALIMALSAIALGVIATLWTDDRAAGHMGLASQESRALTGKAVKPDAMVVDELHRPTAKWM